LISSYIGAIISKASDNAESLVENQKNILDLFPELSYKELKDIMEKWITSIDDDEEEPGSVSEKTVTDISINCRSRN
jgi:predicted AAA+ superfamily ATPase